MVAIARFSVSKRIQQILPTTTHHFEMCALPSLPFSNPQLGAAARGVQGPAAVSMG